MIPPFNSLGNLPAGVHPATLAETADRFGGAPELRRVQMESVRWMVELAKRAGVERIVLNGSFVTNIMEPNDVDCVLLISDANPGDAAAVDELKNGLPFLDISIVGPEDFHPFNRKVVCHRPRRRGKRNDRGDPMTLKNDRQLANTREKLSELEARYEELRVDSSMNPRVRELTMHSFKRLINQMKEEIVLFDIHHHAGAGG